MTPAISVVICLHNSSRYIDETIGSVLSQAWTNFEAVIVDDGSTDGCADRVERLHGDPRLRIVRRPHRGMGYARADGISLARGTYVAFLDHDDVWQPLKLSRQMEVAAARPRVGLIFCDSSLIDDSGRVIALMSDRYDYTCVEFDEGASHHELLARGCFIPLSTALVRRDVIARAGGVNCKLSYAGDYDLWLRISRISALAYVAEPLSSWRIHDAQSSQRHRDLAAAELAGIWASVVGDRSYPAAVRALVAEHLIGQQRQSIEFLLRQKRLREALLVGLAVLRDPVRRRCMAARLRRCRIRDLTACARWCGRTLVASPAASPAAFVRMIGDDRVRLKRLSQLSEEWSAH
jgi:GT2 family glycosyltransferase